MFCVLLGVDRLDGDTLEGVPHKALRVLSLDQLCIKQTWAFFLIEKKNSQILWENSHLNPFLIMNIIFIFSTQHLYCYFHIKVFTKRIGMEGCYWFLHLFFSRDGPDRVQRSLGATPSNNPTNNTIRECNSNRNIWMIDKKNIITEFNISNPMFFCITKTLKAYRLNYSLHGSHSFLKCRASGCRKELLHSIFFWKKRQKNPVKMQIF